MHLSGAWLTPTTSRRGSTWSSSEVTSRCFDNRCRPSVVLKVMDMDEFEFPSDDKNQMADDGDDEDEVSDEELAATMGEWDDRIARFNTVHLTGRIGNDPEPRYFDDGKVVLNLSLATKRKYHSMERKAENIAFGEEETDWFGLEIWGQTAEFASKYIDRGARVGVIGTLQLDQWTDRETGEPRSKAKIVVRELDLLETKAEAELRRANRRGPSFSAGDDDDDDDDGGPSPAGTGGFFSQ